MSDRQPTSRPEDATPTQIVARLDRGESVAQQLADGTILRIDRLLPFLCVYRRPLNAAIAETQRLITGEASYLVAPAEPTRARPLRDLLAAIVRAGARDAGAFLLLEIWAGPPVRAELVNGELLPPQPHFRVIAPPAPSLDSTVSALATSLERITLQKRRALVTVDRRSPPHPRGLPSLLGSRKRRQFDCHTIGIEVRPIWRDHDNGTNFPVLRRLLSRRFSRALKQTFFEFTRAETRHRPQHYHALGTRALVKAVWEVDRQLAEIERSFDLLLLLTPVNADSAYAAFARGGFREAPRFLYRPLPVDPDLLKRRLHSIRVERVEDPTLSFIFRDKRDELDRRITMLHDRDTSRVLYGSLQLFGAVEQPLLDLAVDLLARISPRSREGRGGSVGASEFARRARQVIARYKKSFPALAATVEVRDDIGSSLMVSSGRLLVGQRISIPASRVEALIAHEVETHVLTYYNGSFQPLQLLSCGLGGYDELQEGLAVLSEYLVGGLSRPRVRLLAARVLAARRMVDGVPFAEVYRILHHEHGFTRKTAYTVTMRIFRGGGVVKDAVYLRGLVRLLAHLQAGKKLEPLLIGKISADDVPLMLELRRRGVLREPPLRPAYLDLEGVPKRLARVRAGATVLDLLGAR